LENDYREKGGYLASPFIITIDDSIDHTDDYENIGLQRRFVNLHYRHPQAKRFNKASEEPLVISDIEKEPGQAAMNIYYAAKMSLQQNMQQDRNTLYQRNRR